MYRLSVRDFDTWLNQEIWTNYSIKEPRKYILYDFADELTRWMRKKGYRMDHRWGRTAVTNWIYRLSVRIKIGQSQPRTIVDSVIHRNLPEDLYRFHTVIGSASIQDFMSEWSLCEEFTTELPLGRAIQTELESLLWSYLDLETSEQGDLVVSLLEQEDSDGEFTTRRVDEYIQDAAEGFHGGVGYKV